MRNIFAHDYENTNLEEAWVTIEVDIAMLANNCRNILLDLDNEE